MSRVVNDERGAISTFLAVIALALLMAAGLAIDGGRKVNALREASHLADNAAHVTVAGDSVTVTISLTVDPVLLPTGPITVTATETATAITLEP